MCSIIAASKLGFGGKMCIDGTTKFEEEKENSYEVLSAVEGASTPSVVEELITDEILQKFPEIKAANISLLHLEIPCIIISVEKNRKGHIRELHQNFCVSVRNPERIKMILYVEHTVDPNDLTTALWRFCNNLDPKRDAILFQRGTFACMGFDGTRKTNLFDNFQRDWPNIIVADDATIQSVDEKWSQLGIGAFVPSPSLKFNEQMYGKEAVAFAGEKPTLCFYFSANLELPI